MPAPAWSMSEIDRLERDAFVTRLGHLFEGSPWIVSEAWASRPWGTARGAARGAPQSRGERR